MGFYDTKGDLAARLVEKFSLGNMQIANINTETYNTTTGQVTRGTTTVTVPFARTLSTQEKQENWSANRIIAYVAGNHLESFVPVVDAIVTLPNGTSHAIREIEDYPNGVAYKLYLDKDTCQV